MDNAVALVQAYLHVNGYFTVAEYPVVEAVRRGGYRMATDLDILAFRFSGAARLVPGKAGGEAGEEEMSVPDPELRCPTGESDMLIGEVKEGRAKLNPSTRRRDVLSAVLTRFGCCPRTDIEQVVASLMQNGRARTPMGHDVRIVVFGAVTGDAEKRHYQMISLGHVVRFLQNYLRRNWPVLRHAQLKDPAFGFLAALEKALNASD